MISFNKDANGQKIRVNFNRVVSTGTAFEMTLEPKVGEPFTVVSTLGTADVVVGDEKFLANEFVEFTTTTELFITYIGIWRKKATATLPAEIVASPFTQFRVTP